MIMMEGSRKRPFEEGRFDMMNKLTFPTIPRSQLTNEPIILEGIIEGNQVRRILVDGGSSSEIMYEHYFRNLDVNIRSKLRRCKAPMTGFSWETYHPLGVIDLRVTIGREGRTKTMIMEFAIVKCRSPYYIIIGRTRMRSLRAVGSIIHSMIKFSTNQGVVTIETSREALRECKYVERVQDVMRENIELFAWTRSERTVVPRFFMEHKLKIYPLAEPVVHKRQTVAPEGKLAMKEKVFRWLGEGLIRKMDYSGLNKACAKDVYPLLEEGEELASLMGYSCKCFLQLLKEYSQIRMAEVDEEKTRSKRIERENILGRNSNKKKKCAGPGSKCKRNTKKAEKGKHQDRSGHVLVRSEGRKVSQLHIETEEGLRAYPGRI
ncbi:reverse transcriptase domain-containing protein [Tanacetum coccineum]